MRPNHTHDAQCLASTITSCGFTYCCDLYRIDDLTLNAKHPAGERMRYRGYCVMVNPGISAEAEARARAAQATEAIFLQKVVAETAKTSAVAVGQFIYEVEGPR